MKIIFFGSAHFAVAALKALISSPDEISLVVTQPDKKKGRFLHLGCTDIKTTALNAGLKIYQPEKINSTEAVEYLKGFSADLFVIVAYGQILAQSVLDIPKVMSLNIHASLLPKYRGAAPINWAIIRGEKYTGVSIIKVIRKMDAGPIILQEETAIEEEDNSLLLEDRLSLMGSGLLLKSIKQIKGNVCKLTIQDERKVMLAPKLIKNNGLIDWEKPAVEIFNLIRGTLPWPGAFTYYKNKLLKVYKAKVSYSQESSGLFSFGQVTDVTDNGIVVLTGKGSLSIQELKLEGGRCMSAKEFIHGHKIKPQDRFGK